jgi:peptide/nickel transport system permease protein
MEANEKASPRIAVSVKKKARDSEQAVAERPPRRRRRVRITFALAAGVFICLTFAVVALIGPPLVDYDPAQLDFGSRLEAPSLLHPFGTDEMGRDLFSAVITGARISLLVGIVILAIAGSIGTILGLVAGYFGGQVDNLIMRVTDVFLGFPSLIIAMVISVALGGGLIPAVVGVALVWWPGYARLARGPVLSLKESPYVEAARSIGASEVRVLSRHILPGIVSPLLVKAAADFGYAILATASLSFIGLGARPPSPEWGRLVVAGRDFLLDYPWISTFPGIAIFIVVLGFNLLGDALRDWLDPRGSELT